MIPRRFPIAYLLPELGLMKDIIKVEQITTTDVSLRLLEIKRSLYERLKNRQREF